MLYNGTGFGRCLITNFANLGIADIHELADWFTV
jgi:hypothetical protein